MSPVTLCLRSHIAGIEGSRLGAKRGEKENIKFAENNVYSLIHFVLCFLF